MMKMQDELIKGVADVENTLQKIAAPNMRALEKYVTLYTKLINYGDFYFSTEVLMIRLYDTAVMSLANYDPSSQFYTG